MSLHTSDQIISARLSTLHPWDHNAPRCCLFGLVAGSWGSLRSGSAVQTAACSDGTLRSVRAVSKAGGARRKLELNGLAETPQPRLRPG